MTPRLRDLIAELSESLDETALSTFANQLADRQPLSVSMSIEAPDVRQLKDNILNQASGALLAQATYSQNSVVALLKAVD
jgi:hypothetical protein